MTDTLRFEVLPPNAALIADGVEYPAGQNEIDDPSPELVRLAHHAHAAGAILLEGDPDVAAYGVQSQEDGEAALAEAMGTWVAPEYAEGGGTVEGTGRWSGPWHDDNVALYEQTQQGDLVAVVAGEGTV